MKESAMYNSLQHLLKSKRTSGKVCVVNLKTTGEVPYYHDVYEICIVPLDLAFNIDKEILPFTMRMRLKHPERADSSGITKVDLIKLIHARDDVIIKDLFLQWFKRYFKEGDPYRIVTLSYNIPRVFGFLNEWLEGEFLNCFNPKHYIDLLATARFIDDRYDLRNENPPFCQYTLTRLFQTCSISKPERGDTLSSQSVALLKLYKELLTFMVY
jgi:hypothetical protein